MTDGSRSGAFRDIRVVEFTHMIMGPTCGMILGDLGADVIKVEPLTGDKTRRLTGSGAGFFPTFNRNKKSIAVDLKSPEGREAILRLIERSDVVIENFRSGTMQKLRMDYESLSARNPRLVYCALKGFLDGPYEDRPALDEVVQMMGGLAYMTGPPGRPLRAGASVNDIMGAMFGAIAIMAALKERERTGRGSNVKSGLFETCVFMMGQHMAQEAVTGEPVSPMPARVASWAVYDLFPTADNESVFVGIVSDGQWKTFCETFGRPDLLADEDLKSNTQRVAARDRIIPIVAEIFGNLPKANLLATLEAAGLPCAPITKPGNLFDDPHLNASGGLLDTVIPGDGTTPIPGLPIAINGERPAIHSQPPRCGEQTREILDAAGYTPSEIAALLERDVVRSDG